MTEINVFSVGDHVQYKGRVPSFEDFLNPKIGGVDWGEHTERARGVYDDLIAVISVTHQIREVINMPTTDGGTTMDLVTSDGRMLPAERWEIVGEKND
jgi:hypothetical protein